MDGSSAVTEPERSMWGMRRYDRLSQIPERSFMRRDLRYFGNTIDTLIIGLDIWRCKPSIMGFVSHTGAVLRTLTTHRTEMAAIAAMRNRFPATATVSHATPV